MDPLTITCAALAFVTTINKTLDIFKRLRCIHKEVEGIIEESAEAEIVLRQVEASLADCGGSSTRLPQDPRAVALSPVV